MVAHVHAVNTAADSENKIHDDAIAAVYGFRGGLVPGVTVYGYMTLPVLKFFGERWLERGRAMVRFKEPVYDGEEVMIEAYEKDSGQLEVILGNRRARGVAWLESDVPLIEQYASHPLPPENQRPQASHEALARGTILGTLTTTLDLATDRMSAPLSAALGEQRAAHPAVLLSLANQLLAHNVVLGPWIHAASDVTNFSRAHDGETLTVRGRVAEQYERKGHEFVVLDVLTSCGERPIQQVLHTAIWQPRVERTAG